MTVQVFRSLRDRTWGTWWLRVESECTQRKSARIGDFHWVLDRDEATQLSEEDACAWILQLHDTESAGVFPGLWRYGTS